jgi:hypothetical protein
VEVEGLLDNFLHGICDKMMLFFKQLSPVLMQIKANKALLKATALVLILPIGAVVF